jgi:hypothetical protein
VSLRGDLFAGGPDRVGGPGPSADATATSTTKISATTASRRVGATRG